MTSRRPYQPLRVQADVRAEILRCKGTQFDPVIADAMIRIIDEDKEYSLTCCKFAPRCLYATPECEAGPVPMREIAPGHTVRCLHEVTRKGV